MALHSRWITAIRAGVTRDEFPLQLACDCSGGVLEARIGLAPAVLSRHRGCRDEELVALLLDGVVAQGIDVLSVRQHLPPPPVRRMPEDNRGLGGPCWKP